MLLKDFWALRDNMYERFLLMFFPSFLTGDLLEVIQLEQM
jgi:hypothetical protein